MPESKFFCVYKNENKEGYETPIVKYIPIINLTVLNKLMKLLEANQKQIDLINKGFKNREDYHKKQEEILNEAFFSK